MIVVKSVKFDGESIHVFKSAIYIFESSSGYTLQLDMIVSEVVMKKYKGFENLITEIELENGRVINSIMHVKILQEKLPQLHLFCALGDIDDFGGITVLSENDFSFPNIESGITIEEIRKIEMPIEDVRLKLRLPIDQAEWLQNQKKDALNEMIKELIYDYWNRQALK